MISEPGTPTLDQLKVLVAVVEAGSFAAAARRLNRATSVVSYSISNLEEQLGLVLFDRQSTRKVQITEAGRMVLVEARRVIGGVDTLRAKTRRMLEGLEPELHLVLDTMMPEHRVVDALTGFRNAFPTVSLHLYVESLGGVMKLVMDRVATLGITGPLSLTDGFDKVAVGSVRLIPVAAPSHPLAQAQEIEPGQARDHVQLVLTDRSGLTAGRDVAVIAPSTWRLGDLGAKHMLLKAGVGWGNMPEPMVAEDLEKGRLVRLEMPDSTGADYPFDAVYRTDTPPGPGATWLIERFRQQALSGGSE